MSITWYKRDDIDGLWLLSNAEIWCQILRTINNRLKFLQGNADWSTITLTSGGEYSTKAEYNTLPITFTLGSFSLGSYPTEEDFLDAAAKISSSSLKYEIDTLWKEILRHIDNLVNFEINWYYKVGTTNYGDTYNPWKNSDWTAYSGLGTSIDYTKIFKWWNPENIEYIRDVLDSLVYAQKEKCFPAAKTFTDGATRKINFSDTSSTDIQDETQYYLNYFAEYYAHGSSVDYEWVTTITPPKTKFFAFVDSKVTRSGSSYTLGALSGDFTKLNTSAESISHSGSIVLPNFGRNILYAPKTSRPGTSSPLNIALNNTFCSTNRHSISGTTIFYPQGIDDDSITQRIPVGISWLYCPSGYVTETRYQGNKYKNTFGSGCTYHKMRFRDDLTYDISYKVNTKPVFDDVKLVLGIYQYVDNDYYDGWKVIDTSPNGMLAPAVFNAHINTSVTNYPIMPGDVYTVEVDLNTSINEPPELLLLTDYAYRTDLSSWFRADVINTTYPGSPTTYQAVAQINPNYSAPGDDIEFEITNLMDISPTNHLEWIRASSTPNDSATILP